MTLKNFLLKLYLWPMLSPEKVNFYQEKIRNAEWEAVKPFIARQSRFLDVGCGAGYNLSKAKNELGCEVQGIDPQPGDHGVGRNSFSAENLLPIDTGFSENLPYRSEIFNVVFSSHVLEHVNDIPQSLREMKRVLHENGALIIGMPTATMAWIGLVTQLLFTTHIRWFNFFMSPFINTTPTKFKFIFLPPSHGKRDRTVLYDLNNYRASKWEQHIKGVFTIQKILLPALYPYPDFRQWFKLRKSKKFSSSVFFICSKKP